MHRVGAVGGAAGRCIGRGGGAGTSSRRCGCAAQPANLRRLWSERRRPGRLAAPLSYLSTVLRTEDGRASAIGRQRLSDVRG